MAVVYVFAGLAKLDSDWLLDAQPLRIWLAARSDMPIIGPLLGEVWIAYAFSWFGAFYDLSIVGFLLWRRTRAIAYATVIVFHTLTWVLFPIGMFPWIMIVATLVFFPPHWPRAWLRNVALPGRLAEPVVKCVAGNRCVALLAIYVAIQLAIPLRSFWPGADPNWTGRGFNFAWRVMLVEKAGHSEFLSHDPSTGRTRRLRTRDYITERQERAMAQDPDMIRTLARRMAAQLRAHGVAGIEVRAASVASLNGRPAQRLIDPRVDLVGPVPPGWILPLTRERVEPATDREPFLPLRHGSVTSVL